jgi:hypothetical protein
VLRRVGFDTPLRGYSTGEYGGPRGLDTPLRGYSTTEGWGMGLVLSVKTPAGPIAMWSMSGGGFDTPLRGCSTGEEGTGSSGDPLLTQHAPVPAARILVDLDRARLVAEVDATLVPLVEQLLDE